eukprot:4898285-Lingulodinium_polyedra.AAC.1
MFAIRPQCSRPRLVAKGSQATPAAPSKSSGTSGISGAGGAVAAPRPRPRGASPGTARVAAHGV